MPIARQFHSPRLLLAVLLLPAVLLFAPACGSDGGEGGDFQQIRVITVGGGTGSGRVVSTDPAVAIDCTITNGIQGATGCDDTFDDAGGGGTFNLVATASTGSTFTAWGGCPSPSGSTCTLAFATSDGDVVFNVTANFTGTPAAACNNPIPIQDAFDSDAGWTALEVADNANSSSIVAFQAAGGNPGGYRQMQHVFTGAGTITVYHSYVAITYNPSTQGAIDHFNYSEDEIELNPPFAGAAVGAGVSFTQGGIPNLVLLRPPVGAFTNTVWETTTRMELDASDFPGLDLTASGGPITFGYYRANTNNGGNLTVTHGIDNWKVEICR